MKCFLGYVLFCAAGLAFAQGGVTVEAFDEQANSDRELVAKGFKLIHHGNESLFIEGEWAGTIFAPKAKLVLGQAEKEIYGRFVGNGITVHQYADFHAIPFNPLPETTIAYFNSEEK